MPAYSPHAQAALLKAANRVFEPKTTAQSLEDLADGVVLAQILEQLDPEFNPSELDASPGTSRYLTNKRNIQAIYKGLFRFIRRQVPELGCQARKFDYHAIAENPEPQGISQLLVVMLSAAAMGPDNQRFVPRIQGLDNKTQAEIMQIIQIIQNDINNSRGDDHLDEAIDAVMEARDIDLLVEEQNAALRQQLDMTKKNLSDYITRLEYLQQSHEELKYEKEKNDRELEVLRKATQDGANSAESIKVLEAQVHEQMEIIARNEEMIRKYERSQAHLESEVQRLTQRSIEADELRDRVTELKHKAEDFEKKANMAERYKQKLESQQHLVKEVQNLQYEKTELQEQLRALANDHERNSRSRKAEDELTEIIHLSEQHLWDEREQKKRLMEDIALLQQEVHQMRVRQNTDENVIKDLQDQLDHGGDAPVGVLGNLGTSSLEDELNDAANGGGQPNIPLEISRLKAENNLLRSSVGSTGEAVQLRRELDEERRQKARLQQSFNDMFEKHAIAQDQIEALIKNMTSEGDQAFVNLKNQLKQASDELEKSRNRESELSTQVADQTRELLDVKTQLSASANIKELKEELANGNRQILESLKTDLDRTRQELRDAIIDRDAQQSQLVDALLSKEKFRKMVEEGNLHEAPSSDADASEAGKKHLEKMDKIERLRARLIELRQQLESSEQDKIDLQRKLKAAQDGEAAAAQKAMSDQIIRNLERENALISTAWYDLTSRLQSNHVVVQRRHDAPRSWLNKQRQLRPRGDRNSWGETPSTRIGLTSKLLELNRCSSTGNHQY